MSGGHTSSRAAAGVRLRIERLVVDGPALSARDGAALRRAVQRELTRLLRRDGGAAFGQGGAVASLSAPVIRIAGPLRAHDLGRRVARSVHHSLTGRRSGNP